MFIICMKIKNSCLQSTKRLLFTTRRIGIFRNVSSSYGLERIICLIRHIFRRIDEVHIFWPQQKSTNTQKIKKSFRFLSTKNDGEDDISEPKNVIQRLEFHHQTQWIAFSFVCMISSQILQRNNHFISDIRSSQNKFFFTSHIILECGPNDFMNQLISWWQFGKTLQQIDLIICINRNFPLVKEEKLVGKLLAGSNDFQLLLAILNPFNDGSCHKLTFIQKILSEFQH